jgi:hypothetical protein
MGLMMREKCCWIMTLAQLPVKLDFLAAITPSAAGSVSHDRRPPRPLELTMHERVVDVAGARGREVGLSVCDLRSMETFHGVGVCGAPPASANAVDCLDVCGCRRGRDTCEGLDQFTRSGTQARGSWCGSGIGRICWRIALRATVSVRFVCAFFARGFHGTLLLPGCSTGYALDGGRYRTISGHCMPAHASVSENEMDRFRASFDYLCCES